MALHVAVIGAGIAGVATALELLRDGHHVALVDPGPPGGEQAASYGNGAWFSPASVVPMSMPGLWRKVPGFLVDPLGPLTIRWQHLPRLAPWLVRFVLAGATVPRVERTARALRALLADAPARHAALAAEAGVPELVERRGLLYAFPDRAAFAAEALAWRLRRDNGVVWRELDGEALHLLEPSLAAHYRFGVLVADGGHCRDPGGYVAALAGWAERQGAGVRRARAVGFDIRSGRLAGVLTTEGTIACERAVIAAGVHSKALAALAGDRVPLESERGYHVEIRDPETAPVIPVMPSDGRMANTLTRGGLRVSGQVELASVAAAPNWQRAEVLLRHAQAAYPGLPAEIPAGRQRRWLGHRPSTADGLPVIGPASACPDIIHAFGHGHVGLAAGPVTGRLVADLLEGRKPVVDPHPYAVTRFS